MAGHGSDGGEVLRWRRWSEPRVLGAAELAHATLSWRPLEQLSLTNDTTDYLLYQRAFTMAAAAATSASLPALAVTTAGEPQDAAAPPPSHAAYGEWP